jgi:hypothetical protein
MKIIGANNVQVQQDCWWSTQDDLCPPAGPHASLAQSIDSDKKKKKKKKLRNN